MGTASSSEIRARRSAQRQGSNAPTYTYRTPETLPPGVHPQLFGATGSAPPVAASVRQAKRLRQLAVLRKDSVQVAVEASSGGGAPVGLEFLVDAALDCPACTAQVFVGVVEVLSGDGVSLVPQNPDCQPCRAPACSLAAGPGQKVSVPFCADMRSLPAATLAYDSALPNAWPLVIKLSYTNTLGAAQEQFTYFEFQPLPAVTGVRLLETKLCTEGLTYSLTEAYGMEYPNPDTPDDDADSNANVCVVCLTDPRNTM
eukprot:gene9821-1772_t